MKPSKSITPIALFGMDEFSDSNEFIYPISEEFYPDTQNGPKPKPNEDEEELDVPGSELDDKDEDVGSEDEENNYYSIGGDNHDDLDETN